MKKAVFAWSSGKDAAYALKKVMEEDDIEVKRLFTTVSEDYNRVSIHGVRESLLKEQVEKIGLPLDTVSVPENCSEERYNSIIKQKLGDYAQEFDIVIYSDLFLEEVKKERERQLEKLDIEGYWPIWGSDTAETAESIINSGFKALTVCVDGEKLGKTFLGREYNRKFLKELPEDTDPCGENGEFHTFVADAPYMDSKIDLEKGEKVTKPTAEGESYYIRLGR